ncbi:MAG: helix-turn-helix transcriptional regulator [Selenomonadaceae bacterium]|nr:helix-turn-helix transcriptional regulator [Selenomonadaceae bacterium]
MFKVDSGLVRRMVFERGLTLREFAKAAGLNGLTATKLVRDNATASVKTISTLARFFGVDGNSLILKS